MGSNMAFAPFFRLLLLATIFTLPVALFADAKDISAIAPWSWIDWTHVIAFLFMAGALWQIFTMQRALDSKPKLSITCGDSDEFEQIGLKEDERRGFNPWVRNLKLLRIDNDSGAMAERCRVHIRTVTPKPTLETFPLSLRWWSNEQYEIDIEPGGSSYVVLAEHLVRDGVHNGDMFWATFLAQPKTEFQLTVVAFAKDSNAVQESFLMKRKHPDDQLPNQDPFPSLTHLPTSRRKGFMKRVIA